MKPSKHRALTVHAPWAWAIIHGGKDIENRSWCPPKWMLDQRIWIHCSQAKPKQQALDEVSLKTRNATMAP